MRLRNDHGISIGSALADLGKDLGKAIARGFGRILGIGAVAALFGAAGGGLIGAIYSLPIIGFAIGGAVIAVVAVFALWLIATWEY